MNTPLSVKIENDCLTIRIGIDTLAFAGNKGGIFTTANIYDNKLFAKEICYHLEDEKEDGSTLLTDMLDQAMMNAVEDGCEGVSYD